MAKQLYDYWFVQFDFPNEEGKPYKSSGGEMVWNEKLKREIPKGWITTAINGVCASCRGVSYGKDDLLPNSNGILVLRGNNIENNHIVYDSNVAFVPYDFINEEQRIKEGDIVMTMSSGSKAHVGKCAMFYKDSEHTFGAFLSKFTPKKEMRYMIFLFLTSEYFKSLITAFCNGTGINNLTNQTFDDVILVLPSEKTLQQFESKVNPLFGMIGNNEENIEFLTKLRDELLPLLMNGQVAVNSDLLAHILILYHVLYNQKHKCQQEDKRHFRQEKREPHIFVLGGDFCNRPLLIYRIFEVSVTVLLYHFIAIVLHGYRTVHNIHHVLPDKYS